MNQIYAGMHWKTRQKIGELFHQGLIEYRKERVTDYPVDIAFIFSFKGRLLDCDNCVGMAKMLTDGLRYWKIIADDSPKNIQSLTLMSKKGKKDEVEIIIT